MSAPGHPPRPQWGPERTYRSRPSLRRSGDRVDGVPLEDIDEADLLDADGHAFSRQAPAAPGYPPGQGYDPGYGPGHGYPQAPPAGWDQPTDSPHQEGQYSAPRAHGQPRPRPQPRPRARTRRRRPVKLVLLLLLVALIVYPFALAQVAMGHLTRVAALSGSADTPGHTYLVIGSDSRAGTDLEAVEGARTDTIMLLHVPRSGPTVMLSIPRDSDVQIPGHGTNKINAAYAFGGAKLLTETVELATGVHVDGYVETGLAGFGDIVDAVGGIEICPTRGMKDDMVGLDVQPGCQQVDGAVALQYARSRHGDPLGDLGRIQRQREVLAQIAKRSSAPATLINPFDAFPLAKAGGSALTVDDDMGMVQLGWFLWGMKQSAGGNGLSLTVPVADISRMTKHGVVVDWDKEKAGIVFTALRDSSTEAIRPIADEQSGG